MSDDWEPEDGAGYIPTEEGGSGRGSMVPESALREFIESKRDAYIEFSPGGASAHSILDDLEELIDD